MAIIGKGRQMKKLSTLVLLLALFVAGTAPARADMKIAAHSTLEFAGVQEAKKVLTTQDEYLRQMTRFNLAVRLRTNEDLSRERYLELLGSSIMEWNDKEKKKIRAAFEQLKSSLQELSLPFPDKVLLVKTTPRP
ncbi:MAG: hypothetical protein V5A84_02830 [Planctomycetota bacterium]